MATLMIFTPHYLNYVKGFSQFCYVKHPNDLCLHKRSSLPCWSYWGGGKLQQLTFTFFFLIKYLFSRVLRDYTRFVHPSVLPSVGWLVCLLVHHTFFINFFSLSHFKPFKSILSHSKSLCKSCARLVGVALVIKICQNSA